MASMFWSPKKEAAQAMGEAPVWPAASAASTLASTSNLKPSWVVVAGIVPAGVSSGRSRAANPIASFSTSLRISSSESPPTSTSPISTFGTDRPERTTTSAMYTPRKPMASAPSRIASKRRYRGRRGPVAARRPPDRTRHIRRNYALRVPVPSGGHGGRYAPRFYRTLGQ